MIFERCSTPQEVRENKRTWFGKSQNTKDHGLTPSLSLVMTRTSTQFTDLFAQGSHLLLERLISISIYLSNQLKHAGLRETGAQGGWCTRLGRGRRVGSGPPGPGLVPECCVGRGGVRGIARWPPLVKTTDPGWR